MYVYNDVATLTVVAMVILETLINKKFASQKREYITKVKNVIIIILTHYYTII